MWLGRLDSSPRSSFQSRFTSGSSWEQNCKPSLRCQTELPPRPEFLLIVGGVAGGASAATGARRLAEDASPIVLFERGPDVSFANCGLPYCVGGEIAERNKLLVVTPELWRPASCFSQVSRR